MLGGPVAVPCAMDPLGEAEVPSFHARRVRNMRDITLGVKQLRFGACEGEADAQGGMLDQIFSTSISHPFT